MNTSQFLSHVVAYNLWYGHMMWRPGAYDGSDVIVTGGKFTCRATRKGGFLFTGDESSARITGGLVTNNVAERRGGAVRQSSGGSLMAQQTQMVTYDRNGSARLPLFYFFFFSVFAANLCRWRDI